MEILINEGGGMLVGEDLGMLQVVLHRHNSVLIQKKSKIGWLGGGNCANQTSKAGFKLRLIGAVQEERLAL
jgi:hypothetical protein